MGGGTLRQTPLSLFVALDQAPDHVGGRRDVVDERADLADLDLPFVEPAFVHGQAGAAGAQQGD